MAATRRVIEMVVDSSILVKGELPGEVYAAEASELMRDWEAGALKVHVTDLTPSEIGSVFLEALRRGRIDIAGARASIERVLELPFELHESSSLVLRAFEIAYRYDQRIYDCFHVALAEREGVDLWTGDERLVNALARHLPFVRSIGDYVPLR